MFRLADETRSLSASHRKYDVTVFDDEPPLATTEFRYQPKGLSLILLSNWRTKYADFSCKELLEASGIIEEYASNIEVPEANQDYERCFSSPLRYLNPEPEPELEPGPEPEPEPLSELRIDTNSVVVKQEEDICPSPSSTMCNPSRSPSIPLKKRKFSDYRDEHQKRSRRGVKEEEMDCDEKMNLVKPKCEVKSEDGLYENESRYLELMVRSHNTNVVWFAS